MTTKPFYLAKNDSGSGSEDNSDLMNSMPVNQVFVKNEEGELVGIGIRQLEDGTILAPNKFGVESGSINFGDLITVSEASGYLGIWNHLNNQYYQVVDYMVPRDAPSSDPYYFKLIEAEYRFDGSALNETVITTNPLTFTYTTQLNARTNSVVLNAAKKMTNVRIRISIGDVTLKYLPTKAAYLSGEGGYNFSVGENVIDFGDSPVPLSEGTTINYEILADNMALRGSKQGIPVISAYLQRGKFVNLATPDTLAPVALTGSFNDLKDKPQGAVDQVNADWNSESGTSQILNKPDFAEVAFSGSYKDLKDSPQLFDGDYNSLTNLPEIPELPEITYPVESVNGKTGEVTLTNEDVGAASATHTHGLEEIDGLITLIGNLNNNINSKVSIGANIPYDSISDAPEVPTATSQLNNDSGFITATDVAVKSVNNKIGEVNLSASDVGAAEAKHTHSISDVTNLQSALDSKFNKTDKIPYGSIINAPGSESYSLLGLSDTAKVAVPNTYLRWNSAGTAVEYTPFIPYSSISDVPIIPTNTNQLTNGSGFLTASTTPVKSVNGKTGLVALTNSDVGAAATKHQHAISEVTGLSDALAAKLGSSDSIPYSRLTGTPTIPSAQIQSDWNQTNSSALDFIKNKPAIPVVNYPVTSVNGKTGTITLSAEDVGAVSPTAIPTKVSQLTNDSNFLTSAPVSSVNSKTGAVSLSAIDVGAAPAIQGTKYYRQANTQVTGVKVKYYTVTSDANGVWTVSLGTDFTELLDVQATAISTATNSAGIRQATISAWTSNSTTLSGGTFSSNLIISLLATGAQGLSMAGAVVVRVRVEGVGA